MKRLAVVLASALMLPASVAIGAGQKGENPIRTPIRRQPSPVSMAFVSDDLFRGLPCAVEIRTAFGIEQLPMLPGNYQLATGGGYAAAAVCAPGGNGNHMLMATASSDPHTAASSLTTLVQVISDPKAKDGPYPGNAAALQLGTFVVSGPLSQVVDSARTALGGAQFNLRAVPANANPKQEAQLLGENGRGSVLVSIHTEPLGPGPLAAALVRQFVIVLAASTDSATAEQLRNQVRGTMTAPGHAPRIR